MTIVLGAVAAVVFVALVASLVRWGSAAARAASAEAQIADALETLQEAVDSAEKLSNDLADQRRRAADAGGRAEAAESRAAGLESELAELRSARSPATLSEIERVRLEREWAEVAGPGAALPVGWDGSIEAALAIELEIIREVTGAPSRLESDSADTVRNAGVAEPVDDGDSWVLAGLGCEMLRVVARYADELVVRLDGGPNGVRRIAAEAFGAPAPPDLTSVEAAAKAVGLSLSVGRTVDSFLVWLSVEDRQPQSG